MGKSDYSNKFFTNNYANPTFHMHNSKIDAIETSRAVIVIVWPHITHLACQVTHCCLIQQGVGVIVINTSRAYRTT